MGSFTLDDVLGEEALVALVRASVRAGEAAKGNGRLVRNLVEAAIARQTNRVFSLGTVSRGTLTTLIEEDFGTEESAQQVRSSSGRSSGRSSSSSSSSGHRSVSM